MLVVQRHARFPTSGHSPFQVDKKYSDLYPTLGPEGKMLAGMVTHTDEMIGGIVTELNSSGLLANTVIM